MALYKAVSYTTFLLLFLGQDSGDPLPVSGVAIETGGDHALVGCDGGGAILFPGGLVNLER